MAGTTKVPRSARGNRSRDPRADRLAFELHGHAREIRTSSSRAKDALANSIASLSREIPIPRHVEGLLEEVFKAIDDNATSQALQLEALAYILEGRHER